MDNLEERLTMDGDDIEIVEKFPYLGDVSSTEGVHEAIIARIRFAWKNLRRFLVYYARRAFHLQLKELYINAMLEAR